MSKLLDVTEKQILRGCCLNICEQAEPLGAGTEVIYSALKKSGYTDYAKSDIEEACVYLEKKGLVRLEYVKNDILNIKRCIAHITAKGTDFLEGAVQEEGLELV